MRVEIIAVGSELLTPDRLDTNSLFITERLNEIGIEVQAKSVVGDEPNRLRAVFVHALERADLVLLTGGLGPTDDDLTRDVVAEVLKLALEYDARVFEGIERRFAVRGLRTPDINRRQAMVPRGATILENPNGTAPGLWVDHEGKTVVLLPGPPREMRPMIESVVRERLNQCAGPVRLYRRVLRITGRTESHVEEAVQPLYSRWAEGRVPIAATILAAPGQIELHLTAKAPEAAQGQAVLNGAVADVEAALGASLFSSDGRSLEQVVGDLLRARRLHIALAESCTGGLASSRLTDVPGRIQQPREGGVAGRFRDVDRGARRRQRGGGRGDGHGHCAGRRSGPRRRDYRNCRSRWRDSSQARWNRRHQRGMDPRHGRRDENEDVAVPGRARTDQISGVAGSPESGPALAARGTDGRVTGVRSVSGV
jgi:nicotinamide-nucleotide amidase